MGGYIPWSSAESLAGLSPDAHRSFRVRRILFELVRDRCAEMGLCEGEEFRCRGRSSEEVAIQLPNGQLHDLEVTYAWFVQVEPVAAEFPSGGVPELD